MKRIIWFGIGLILSLPVFSTNYYLSLNGNNTANGLSPATAWQSIDQLNSQTHTLNPGDTVFFRRGDVFFGQIELQKDGLPGSPIVLGAYGTGAAPVISGSEALSNWTQLPASPIWYTNVSWDTVAYLFLGDKMQTLARYPNQGYLTIDNGNKNQLSCSLLPGGANYWQGATVRIRTSRWTYESRKVASSTAAGQVIFQNNIVNNAAGGWGFFMDNRFQELDQAGEWYFDHALNRVYYWPHNNQNPNLLSLRGSNFEYGLSRYNNKAIKHLEIRDLTFADQIIEGVRLKNQGGEDLLIQHCQFYRQGETGIYIAGKNVRVLQCQFADQLGRGIKGNNIVGGNFEDNTLRRIGMVDGYGYDGNQNMNGFHFTNTTHALIAGNQIDSVGYTAISCYTAYSTIENNILRHSNLRLDDGASIYAYGPQSHHTLIQHNFIEHAVGYPVGTNNPTKHHSYGIYMDQGVTYNTIRHNTIVDVATAGIFINTGNHHMLIEENLVVDFGVRGIQVLETVSANSTHHNLFTHNLVYSYREDTEPVVIFSLFGTEATIATFTQNYLFHPYSEYTMRRGNYSNQRPYTLEEWESISPAQASGNYLSPFQFTGYKVNSDLTGNLVQNGTFDSNVAGWTYTQNANVNTGWLANGGLDGGCFNAQLLNPNANNAAIQQVLTQPIVQGTFYELSYSLRSSGFGQVQVMLRDATNAQLYNKWMPYTPGRRDQTLIFQVATGTPTPRLSFTLKKVNGQHVILDNIVLKAVAVSPEPPETRVERFSNYADPLHIFPLLGTYFDRQGAPVNDSISLPGFRSDLLFTSDTGLTVLDAELLTFTGNYQAGTVQLHWLTRSETDLAYFSVERSPDGQRFEELGRQTGIGQSASPNLYQLQDPLPFAERTYYRLWGHSLNGNKAYLATLEVATRLSHQPSLQVFPNPARQHRLHIQLSGMEADDLPGLQLLDLSGRTVAQSAATQLRTIWELPASLPRGFYTLVAKYQGQTLWQRVMIE